MNKLLLLLSTGILLSLDTYSQKLIVEENFFVGGDTCFTSINKAIALPNDEIMFVGATRCNNSGDIPILKHCQKDWNVLIGKMSASRQLLWTKVYGGANREDAYDICATKDGGFAVLAGTKSNDCDVTDNQLGITDFWLIKIDKDGNLLWENTFGSEFEDIPASITEDDFGNLIMFGGSNGSGKDIPFHYGGIFSFDWVLIKTDSAGNKIWANVYGGTESDGYVGSIIAVDTYYYIASGSSSTDKDCIDTSWFGSSKTSANYHLLKIDSAGKVVWDRSYGGTNGDGIYNALYDSRDSTILLIGKSSSKDYMVPAENFYSYTWLVKTDLNGDTIWTTVPITSGVRAYQKCDITIGYDGGYVVMRDANSNSPDSIIPGKTNVNVFYIDKKGKVISDNLYGSYGDMGYDNPRSITTTSKEYVVAGWGPSVQLSQGKSTGNTSLQKGGGFLSYINYWPTSVMNYDGEHLIKAYPNPSSGALYVSIPKDYTGGDLQIVDVVGVVKFKTRVRKPLSEINIAGWPSGIYYVTYKLTNRDIDTCKIIITN